MSDALKEYVNKNCVPMRDRRGRVDEDKFWFRVAEDLGMVHRMMGIDPVKPPDVRRYLGKVDPEIYQAYLNGYAT